MGNSQCVQQRPAYTIQGTTIQWTIHRSSIISELKMMDLISILFSFIFLLFSLIFYWRVEDKEDKSVTQSQKSHAHMIQGNNDDIIVICEMHVGLKANI